MRKNKSLQQIEDFYISLGYKYSKLKDALTKDEKYQKLLEERKHKLTKKLKLNKEDKFLVRLIKTQLEYDWRKPLFKTLNQILKKYKIEGDKK